MHDRLVKKIFNWFDATIVMGAFFHALSKKKSPGGFSLIEIIVAASMLTVSLVSVFAYYKKVLDLSRNTTLHIQSGFLLEEGFEASKLLRDQGWSTKIATLSTTTTYYFYWNGTQWTSTTSPQNIENTFIRSFTVKDVKRDASDNIASAGTYDPGTKKITISVAWPKKGGGGFATDTAETYMTNLFSN